MEKESRYWNREKGMAYMLWITAGILFFLILCKVQISDGDDLYFYYYAETMKFFEYLAWRYQTWVGRMAGEALVYLTFREGVWFWRVVNACMMVLLPAGVLRLGCKSVGYRSYGDFLDQNREKNAIWGIRYPVLMLAGYLLMNVMTVGYAAIWMNGSIFYTWSFTAGIWAMMPLADLVFDTGCFSWKQMFYALPCSVIAAMSIEQMGAVLLAFEVLTLIAFFRQGKTMPGEGQTVCLIVQLAVTAICFGLLFHAPGNEVRVASEIATWMPGYADLTLSEHLFLVMQWLFSSFAKENRLFFVGIWIAGIVLMENRKRIPVNNLIEGRRKAFHRKSDRIWEVFAGIFIVVAMLPYFGIDFLQEMGNGQIVIEECLLDIPSWQDMTTANRIAFFWWIAAVLFTAVFLWNVTGHSIFLLFVYLGGIASEAIMYFSPTIYASGARVYYLTDWMFLFLILWMIFHFDDRKKKNLMILLLLILGIWNLISQYSVILLRL